MSLRNKYLGKKDTNRRAFLAITTLEPWIGTKFNDWLWHHFENPRARIYYSLRTILVSKGFHQIQVKDFDRKEVLLEF